MTWILAILLNCGAFGCSHVNYNAYPDKASCHEAMDRFLAYHKPEKNDVIYCRPAKEGDK